MPPADKQGRVVVISWPHVQRPPEVLPSDEPPRVPGTAGTEERDPWEDPVWEALLPLRDERRGSDRPDRYSIRGESWDRGFATVVSDLELRALVVNRESRYHPRPNLEGRWGRFFSREESPVDLFRSDLSLNNDGPTVPSRRMLERLLDEYKPRLVISIGLGGGVRPEDQIGDVVVATRAQFALPGDLATSELNGLDPFGGTLTVDEGWFEGIELGELQELALLPASPSFPEPQGGWPQPDRHRPLVRVEDEQPVLTRPAISAPAFVPAPYVPAPPQEDADDEDDAPPDLREFDTFIGAHAVVDMDAAVAAKACAKKNVPFAAVIGLTVPALARLPVGRPPGPGLPADIRDAWATTFNRQFAPDAAGNAVLVARRLIERAAT